MLRAFGILSVSVLAYAVSAGLALAQQAQGSPAPAPLQRQETESDAETLLDRNLESDPARIEEAKAKAAQTPPATENPDTLAAFFYERAAAAYDANLPRQQLEDLRRAAEHARRGASIDKTQVLQRLANVEKDRGLRAAAVRTMTEAIALNPPTRRSRLIGLYVNLAYLNVQAGNVEGADAALAQVRVLRREMENDPRFRSSEGTRRTIAQAIGATGPVLLQKGKFVEAEAVYRDVVAMYERLGTPGDRRNALNNRAGLATSLRLQGRLAESENEVRQVLTEAQREFGASSLRTSAALMQLAAVLADQGRYVEAEGLMRKGIELVRGRGFQGTGDARIQLASILADLGKWREALAEFETAKRSYGRNNVDGFEIAVRRNVIYGLSLLWSGRSKEGLERLRAVYEANQAELGEKHYVTAESQGFYATALAVAGQSDLALGEFAAAAEILLSRSRESSDTDDAGSTSAQDQRLRMILEGYIGLLAGVRRTDLPQKHGIDPVAESFRLADAARSRGVLRALTASAARSAAANPQLADAARRVQDAEKQISALNGMLANAISARAADRDESGIKNLRQRIDGLRDERSRLLREIGQKFPDYARLIDPRPATIADVRATLRPGEAMVAFLAGVRRTTVWIVTSEGPPAMIVAPLDRAALTTSIGQIRKALDPHAATLDDIPAFDVAEAHKLYAALLQPAESILRSARNLFVVPDGPFGQLPLGVLVTAPTTVAVNAADGVPFSRYRSVPWLIRQASVTQLPSVASLAALRALPAGNAQRRPFVGFGDPWFSKEQAAEAAREAAAQVAGLTTRGIPIRLRSAPKVQTDFTAQIAQLPRLADTADEVRAVAAALRADPVRDLFIGAKASASQVKALDLSAWRIVMFATHGLVPGDLSGLNQPALALSAPDVTGNAKDGLLTVEDILALKLNADWVVLSACNTAAGQGAGAEAVSGLGRAFFYAGTRALLVSNWPVETSSARLLTTDLFRRQVENPAVGRAEALRQAELALIDGPGFVGPDGKPLFSYAHPIFWAPFSLIGDGGTAGK